MNVELVVAVENQLGEGPLWNPDEQKLYWLDIAGHKLHRYDPRTEDLTVYDLAEMVTAIAFRKDGGLVMTTTNGFVYGDAQGKIDSAIHLPEAHRDDNRFNDGAVDRAGRFWAGTIGSDSLLYRLDTDGSLHTMERGIEVSNGIGWSPDNRYMYYSDSPKRCLFRYDFDLATGAISNRVALACEPDSKAVTDGLTVDSEGYIWMAWWDGWKVVRYAPDGSVDRVIDIPAQRVTSCMFGGENLDELYITSARTGLSEDDLAKQPLAGGLFRIKTDVKGLPESYFGG